MPSPQLTEDKVNKLKKEVQEYKHGYAWWRDVDHIAEARKVLLRSAKPQHRQCNNDYTRKYAHDEATLGMLKRPVYFDLGVKYDLVDDSQYDELVESIISAGNVENAKYYLQQSWDIRAGVYQWT